MPNGLTGSDYTDLNGNTVPGIATRHAYCCCCKCIARKRCTNGMQTYAEVEFLKAEAAIRGWTSGSDKTHYKAGVTAAMKMLKQIYPATTAITDAEISTFLAGPGK